MNFCPNCGKRLSKQSKFCTHCGHELIVNVNTHERPGTAPSFDYSQSKRHSQVEAKTPEQGDMENDSTVEFQDLHPNAVWLFFIRYMGRSIILLPLIILAALYMPLLWILLAVYIGGHLLVSLLVYRNFRFEITPTAFHKEYGIIHKRHASIPFETIENINISRNLLDRMLGLAHIEIETAGISGNAPKDVVAGVSATSEGYIPGLSRQEAQDLRDLMLLRAQNFRT